MPSTSQKVKADANTKGLRAVIEVVTFKEVRIDTKTTDRRV